MLPVFYECDICGQKYSKKKNLEYHQISFHDKIVDPKFVRTDEEKRRLVTLAMTTYTEGVCALCGQTFTLVNHLRRHLAHQHELRLERKYRAGKEGEVRNFECPFCDRRYIARNALRHHLINIHDIKTPVPLSMMRSLIEKRVGGDVNQSGLKNVRGKCTECGYEFASKRMLQYHMHNSHGAELPESSYTDKQEKRRATCHICSMRFSKKMYLTRHIERAHRVVAEEYTEKEEGEETAQAPVETKFPCHICAKVFGTSFHRDRHLKRVHKIGEEVIVASTQEAPVAVIDDEKLKPGKILRTKARKDMSAKQMDQLMKGFQCEKCSTRFMNPSSVRTHMISVHGVAPKPKTNLTLSTKLKLGKRRTTGKTVAMCDLCGRGFTRKYYLRAHLVSVHGIKANEIRPDYHPYECDICKLTFSEKRYMTRHLKDDHGVVVKTKYTSSDAVEDVPTGQSLEEPAAEEEEHSEKVN